MKNGPKMSDIAKRLGISTVTVSKALSGKEGVSEELRLKIKQLAWELNYQYKPSVKPKSQETYMIGIVLDGNFLEPRPSFYWAMYQQLIEALKDRGYYGIFEIYRWEGSQTQPDFIKNQQVDGIIAIGYLPQPYLERLAAADLPMVHFDSYCDITGVISVLPDNLRAATLATNYLIQKGHQQIGFVGSFQEVTNIRERFLGYYQALLVQGVQLQPEWLLEDRDGLHIRTNYQLPAKMPTAFVCNCDQTAYCFSNYLQQAGWRVPEDVSIIGFYDYEYATLGGCQLTTVKIDMKQMASTAVDCLLRRWDRQPLPSNTVLVKGRILERSSVLDLNR